MKNVYSSCAPIKGKLQSKYC